MKTRFLLFMLITGMLFTLTVNAQQGVAVNTTGATANPSAILDVSSTSQGLLIPRMNNAERTTISNPANGLIVFDTDCSCLYYFISTGPSSGAWKKLVEEGSNSGLYDVDGDSYLTLNYDNSDDDTVRLFFEDEEKYRISSKAIEQLNNGQSVFIGEAAGRNNDGSSTRNTFIGYHSGYQNINTSNNTAVGGYALSENIGISNTALGTSALRYKSTGNYNIAVGGNSQMRGISGSRNTSVGYMSLYKSTGQFNVAIGDNALSSDSLGEYNTAIGARSLFSNYDGTYNSTLGYSSLFYNTGGSNNVAIGYNSSFLNSTGDDNIAIGSHALFQNETSSNNIAIGTGALYGLDSGTENLAIGIASMNMADIGSYNTSVGTWTLYNNKAGSGNTAMGHYCMAQDSSGSYNSGIGYNTLYNNKTGHSNVAMGPFALFSNTTSGNLVAIGDSALFHNGINASEPAHASKNVAIGSKALYANTIGRENTAIGFEALKNSTTGAKNSSIGAYTLGSVTTGDDNTAMGYTAAPNGNHSQGTFIGSYIDISTARSNVSVLGYGVQNAQCTGNNQVLLGNTAIGQVRSQVSGLTVYSDGRFKSNISENVPGLDFINRLRPVTYNENPEILHQIWGTPESVLSTIDHSEIKQQRFIGFVAQDVEKAAKECGFEFPGIDIPRNDHEVYSLRYGDFIMPMVKAIQEQQIMIEAQNDIINQQKSELEALKSIVEEQGKILSALKSN
jgi:trimeric autotransporter adhesin